MNLNGRKFHSCYVIDIVDETQYKRIRLTDSNRLSWFIDSSDEKIGSEFKNWLKNVFFKGIAGALTIFEYEDHGEAPDIENYVVKFINVPKEESKVLNG